LLLSANAEDPSDPGVRRHLSECADCRKAWRELKELGELLRAGSEPVPQVSLVNLYREAAQRQARSTRRWRWVGLAAALLLALGGLGSVLARVEIHLSGEEFVVRWGQPRPGLVIPQEHEAESGAAAAMRRTRAEQLEVLTDTVRAMVQELQTMEMRQRRDRADFDTRVAGMQEQSLKRWIEFQRDLNALYMLTQKGE
jgi:hypothetical protein